MRHLLSVALLLAVSSAQAANITVDGTNCTLADAITAANTDASAGNCPAGSGADTITLQVDVTLSADLPQIASAITLEGGGHFISGNNARRVLYIVNTGNLTLNATTVKDGKATSDPAYGGGIYNDGGTLTLTNSTVSGNTASYGGGGICNYGTATLTNSTVSGNTASSDGGGIYNYVGTLTLNNSTVSGNTASSEGGGIYNYGTATLTNSTVSGNTASYGGGIYNVGTLTLNNSTVSGNTASYGGGISNLGTLTLNNSTVSGNTASSNGGGIYAALVNRFTLNNSTVSSNSAAGKGGGILFANWSEGTLRSSLISGNTAASGKEVYNDSTSYGGTVTADSFNVFGHSGETSAQAFNGFTPGASDVNATSDGGTPAGLAALLSPLTNNGSPTKTHALPVGSLAIDLDAACSAGLSTDQRGFPRPAISGTGCDAGAYERQTSILIPVNGTTCTLADAITAANTDTATGGCPAGSGADTITLLADVTLAATLPQISSVITIEGGGHFISGNKAYSVLYIANTGNLTLNETTVKDGKATSEHSYAISGGGIVNIGTIKLTNSTVSGNIASDDLRSYGGGIYNSGTIMLTNSTVSSNTISSKYGTPCGGGIYNEDTGTITLTDSTVSGNTTGSPDISSDGGGICNYGTVTLTNSTVSGNKVSSSSSSSGGGIYNHGGTVTLTNSTVSGNGALSSSSFGGGIFNLVGTVTLTNSTVRNNNADSLSNASSCGGGIYNLGTATLTNSTVSDNRAFSSSTSPPAYPVNSYGGGIFNRGTITLTNSTVSGNQAVTDVTGTYGGGIYSDNGTVTLRSSLVSGNTSTGPAAVSGKEVYSAYGTVTADSFNVFGHSEETSAQAFDGFTPGARDVNAASDGTPALLAAVLSPLAANGGPTETHALPVGSPAIDLDTECSAMQATDQRGIIRPTTGCDAGAVEYSPSFSTACGNGRDLPANTWLMTAPSCQPAVPPGISIDAQYGNDIPGGVYGTNWIAYSWNPGNQDYVQETAAAPLTLGAGNWVYSTAAATLALDGAATPTTDCTAYGSSGQCFDIDLAIAPSGQNHWNMVGQPFPYTVNWADVKVAVSSDGGVTWTAYTPSAAETAGYASKTFHRWTGSAYEPKDDSTPGSIGILQPQEAVWLRSLGSYSGPAPQKLKLLIPAQ